MGQHLAPLLAKSDGPDRIMYTVKWVYLCEFFSIMCPGFGRISFAFLLLSIIPPTRWRKIFLWSVIGAQFVVDVGTVIISFSQCRPIEGFWDKGVNADCWEPYVQQYTGFAQGCMYFEDPIPFSTVLPILADANCAPTTAVCSLVDFVLAVFPATLFWSLKMELKQKLALSGLMGLGIL